MVGWLVSFAAGADRLGRLARHKSNAGVRATRRATEAPKSTDLQSRLFAFPQHFDRLLTCEFLRHKPSQSLLRRAWAQAQTDGAAGEVGERNRKG